VVPGGALVAGAPRCLWQYADGVWRNRSKAPSGFGDEPFRARAQAGGTVTIWSYRDDIVILAGDKATMYSGIPIRGLRGVAVADESIFAGGTANGEAVVVRARRE
jgi:hypothetical protein